VDERMKPKRIVMKCKTEGSIHEGYLCHHKLERYSEYHCEKCKNKDVTDEKW
jgi:hypothetical protein